MLTPSKSELYELLRTSGCSTLMPSLEKELEQLSSVTPAYQARSNEGILIDKSPLLSPDILEQKSFLMSGAASTSSGKDCAPYWNDRCVEIASQLWLPTVTDSAASASISCRGFSSEVEGASWFSTTHLFPVLKQNLFKISSPSSGSSPQECTDFESTEKRCKKIRIYPSSKVPEPTKKKLLSKVSQRETFRRWFGASRKAYNETVAFLNTVVGKRPPWTIVANHVQGILPAWSKEIPYTVLRMAVKDACTAYSAGKKKAKQTGEPFKLHFRSRKDKVQSCFIPNDAVQTKGVYPRISGELLYSEDIPDAPCDSRMLLDHGRWYLCVPYTTAATPLLDNQGRLVALDPGVRTFMTYFSSDAAGHLGKGDYSRIVRLCQHLDKLYSKATKAKSGARQKMRKAAARMQWKIRDLVDEMHWKIADFLVNNFDVIILPLFETREMSSRTRRKIGKKSVRSMLTWAHYRFAQKLLMKARRAGKEVIRNSEAWTSKTASWSGEIRHNLGGAKTFHGSDGISVDRDINGARGIFLRALSDTTSPLFGRGAFVGVQ